MNTFPKSKLSALLPLLLLLQACAGSGETIKLTEDGLAELSIEGIEYIAVHPGAQFAEFTEIYVEPVVLEFRSGWRPTTTGSQMSASQYELEQLQDELQALFTQEFIAGLQQNPRLRIVDAATPDALRVSPRLGNVTFENFGSKMSAGQSAARKLGQAELELLVRDVQTDTVVVRMKDKRVLANPHMTFAVTSTANTYNRFGELFMGWGGFIGKGVFNIETQ